MLEKVNFYCLGAAHLDVKARALLRPAWGESIPVTTRSCLGGVVCNIAADLAHEGAPVAICSLVGHDHEGQSVLQALRGCGIDCSDMGLSPSAATGRYYALLADDGELFIAMADMGIYEELTPERIVPLLLKRRRMSDWVIDANVPKETIKAIVNHAGADQRLWAVGVSAAKAPRLATGFPHWYGLLINAAELASLTGEHDLRAGMRTLRGRGCTYVIVTAGAQGVFYSQGQRICHRPCPPTKVIDVTGAGDAFSAGVIYALAHEEHLDCALDFGFSLAAKALLSPRSSLIEVKL